MKIWAFPKCVKWNLDFNKNTLIPVTGALWKVSLSSENVDKLEDLGVVVLLICILVENSERLDDLQFNFDQAEVLTNVVGAMAETAKLEVSTRSGH